MAEKMSYEELEQQVRELKNSKTQLKELEERLNDEINWHRLLVDESRDGIVILRQDGSVFEANRKYADMLGYSVEQEEVYLHKTSKVDITHSICPECFVKYYPGLK